MASNNSCTEYYKALISVRSYILVLAVAIMLISWAGPWINQSYKNYTIHYQVVDKKNKKEYIRLINKGIQSVEHFFGEPFKKKFDIYILPDRESFNEQWRNDYKDPGFKSECWMVASGVAN